MMKVKMQDFLLKRQEYYSKKLEGLGERTRPVYEEEVLKTALAAKLNLIKELLEEDKPVGLAVTKTYRVELVDYIDATSEHEAIEVFEAVIFDLDASDDMYDVHEVDPFTKKVVK